MYFCVPHVSQYIIRNDYYIIKYLKLIDPLISVYFNFMTFRVNARIDTALPYVGIAEIYDVYHRYIMETR